MSVEPMTCSDCGIDQEETGIHHTWCEGFPDCTISVCDPCRTKRIVQGKWVVCEPHDEEWWFDKCKTCYDIEGNRNPKEEWKMIDAELRAALEALGEHGFKEEATYVFPNADAIGNHSIVSIERRTGWDGMEHHFRVGCYDYGGKASAKYAGQWLTDEAQKQLDWDEVSNTARLHELEYKTWDDLLNDKDFEPQEEMEE